METLTATATASFIVSSGWLPTKQDKRNAHNTHSKCQSVFNEQRALAAPPSLATLVAPLARCCDFLRKSENQLARNQIEPRVGVATAAATSQHRQCCGKQGRRERERETVGCCHNNWQTEQQQQQQLDEAKAYAAMRVSSCRLSPWLVCLCVLHIERGRQPALGKTPLRESMKTTETATRWHRQCARPHAKRNKLFRPRPGDVSA